MRLIFRTLTMVFATSLFWGGCDDDDGGLPHDTYGDTESDSSAEMDSDTDGYTDSDSDSDDDGGPGDGGEGEGEGCGCQTVGEARGTPLFSALVQVIFMM